jgi:hypothetical protein
VILHVVVTQSRKSGKKKKDNEKEGEKKTTET